MTYFENLNVINELVERGINLYDLDVAQNVQDAFVNTDFSEKLNDEELFNFVCERTSEAHLKSDDQCSVLNDVYLCAEGVVGLCHEYNWNLEELRKLNKWEFIDYICNNY